MEPLLHPTHQRPNSYQPPTPFPLPALNPISQIRLSCSSRHPRPACPPLRPQFYLSLPRPALPYSALPCPAPPQPQLKSIHPSIPPSIHPSIHPPTATFPPNNSTPPHQHPNPTPRSTPTLLPNPPSGPPHKPPLQTRAESAPARPAQA